MKATAYFCVRTAADEMLSYFIVIVNDKNDVLRTLAHDSFGTASEAFKSVSELNISQGSYHPWYAVISDDERKIIVKRYDDDAFVIKEANIIDKVEISY